MEEKVMNAVEMFPLTEARLKVEEAAEKLGLSVEDYLKMMEEKERKEEQEEREVEKRRLEKLKQKQIIDLREIMETYGLTDLKALPSKEKGDLSEAYVRLINAFIMAKRLTCNQSDLNNLLVFLLDEFTSVEIIFGLKDAITKMEGFFDFPLFRRFLFREIRPKYEFMYDRLSSNAHVEHLPVYRLKEPFKIDVRKMIENKGEQKCL